MIKSFPPLICKSSTGLILGTMPGEKSLRANEYYAHRGNQFWKIMFSIFDQSYSEDYTKRIKLITDNNLAIWDILQYCEREGSSDNAIQQEKPNDFKALLNDYPKIKHIFFNGQNPESYFHRFIGYPDGITFHTLPSTSPANTWMNLQKKNELWAAIREVLL